MATKTKKGASVLRLNNTELRRELHRADIIIMHAVSLMTPDTQELLKHQLERCHTTDAIDPLGEDTRLQAMHRITPKRDYSKLFFIIAAILLSAMMLAKYYV